MYALLSILLSQAPISTTAPAQGTAPWVQRHLMSMDWLPTQGPVVRVEGRVLRIQDDTFAQHFVLVPAAEALASTARASFDTGTRWMTASVVTLSVGAAIVTTGALLMPTSAQSLGPALATAGGGLVTMLAGLVLSLIAMPSLQRAQNDFFGAISTYNRGLLDIPPVVVVEP